MQTLRRLASKRNSSSGTDAYSSSGGTATDTSLIKMVLRKKKSSPPALDVAPPPAAGLGDDSHRSPVSSARGGGPDSISPGRSARKGRRRDDEEDEVAEAAQDSKVNKRGSIRTSKVKAKPRPWSEEEDETLRAAVASPDGINKDASKTWEEIALTVPGRLAWQCQQRWNKVLAKGIKKGKWSVEEDDLLRGLVEDFIKDDRARDIDWKLIQEKIPGRHTRQCRERWNNFLSPNLKRCAWSEGDKQLLLQRYQEMGPRWADISKLFEGRTTDSVKSQLKSLLKDPTLKHRASFSSTISHSPIARRLSGESDGTDDVSESKSELDAEEDQYPEYYQQDAHGSHVPFDDFAQGQEPPLLLPEQADEPILSPTMFFEGTGGDDAVAGAATGPEGSGGHGLPQRADSLRDVDVLNSLFEHGDPLNVAKPPAGEPVAPALVEFGSQSSSRSRVLSAEEIDIFHSNNAWNLELFNFNELSKPSAGFAFS